MFILNENDREYRFGDSGPKYLIKGPRSNFALLRLMPGEDFPNHYHNIMEENFYIIEGEIEFIINGELIKAKEGDFIHIEPKEHHYLRNASDKPVKMTASLAPYQIQDKVDAPLEDNLKMKEKK